MRFLQDHTGLEAVEYIAVGALIVAVVFGVLVVLFTAVADKLRQINAGL